MKIRFPWLFLFLLLLGYGYGNAAFQLDTDTTQIGAKKRTRSKLSVRNDSLVYELGNVLEKAIHNNNSNAFNDRFDLSYFINRSTEVEYVNPSIAPYTEGYAAGMQTVIKNFVEKLSTEVSGESYYDFIDYYYDYDIKKYRLLFRLFSEEGGVNYHDFVLTFKEGRFLAADIYVYTNGQYLTQTMNTFFRGSLPKSFIEKMLKAEEKRDFDTFLKALAAKRQGNYEKALNLITQIKGDLKHNKTFHTVKIEITSHLDESLYAQALTDMVQDYEDDPTMRLSCIDYYLIKEDYTKALSVLNVLEEATGDSFLNFIRGNIAFQANDYELSASSYEKIMSEYPEYYTTYTSVLSPYAQMELYEKCVVILDKLVRDDAYDKITLIEFVEEDDEFGENTLEPLVQSEAYQNWKNSK